MKNNDVRAAGVTFSIVGMGASTGGLVALTGFLPPVPPDSGIAFVVVQHLDPHREGTPVELLQRHTAVPVVKAQDQRLAKPDHGCVIPPEPRGLRLPSNLLFFKSLDDVLTVRRFKNHPHHQVDSRRYAPVKLKSRYHDRPGLSPHGARRARRARSTEHIGVAGGKKCQRLIARHAPCPIAPRRTGSTAWSLLLQTLP